MIYFSKFVAEWGTKPTVRHFIVILYCTIFSSKLKAFLRVFSKKPFLIGKKIDFLPISHHALIIYNHFPRRLDENANFTHKKREWKSTPFFVFLKNVYLISLWDTRLPFPIAHRNISSCKTYNYSHTNNHSMCLERWTTNCNLGINHNNRSYISLSHFLPSQRWTSEQRKHIYSTNYSN